MRARTRRRLRALRSEPAPRRRRLIRRPRLVVALVVVGIAVPAGVLGGPVAATIVAVYAIVTATVLRRRQRRRIEVTARSRALDAMAALAADLRAGLAAGQVLAVARPVLDPVPAILARVSAAWRIADVTGAPLADLLDRLEVDLRGLERIRLVAGAHAAGTRATAGLLAALPVAGIGLGYGMGADPLAILLGTPVGAVCAVVAVALQVVGLAWTDRLARLDGELP